MEQLGDLRRPLDGAAVRRALAAWPFYVDVEASPATGSTNADVAELARRGFAEGTVRAVDYQHAGRGRLTRTWTSPPSAGVALSVLLRPTVPRESWTWLPLLAGLAVARAVDRVGVEATLKWPNDVLVDGRKIAGVLVEVVGAGAADAVVVGIGLNVSNRADELPPGATSIALEGGLDLDRVKILADLLVELATSYERWTGSGGDHEPVRTAYVERCTTIGRAVRVELPGGQTVEGVAHTVDGAGRLVVGTDAGDRALGAGDVVHVR